MNIGFTDRRLLMLAAAGLALVSLPINAKEPSTNLQLARQLNDAFAEVAEKVTPAVVVITVVQRPGTDTVDIGEDGSLDGLPPELWRYFRRQFGQQTPEKVHGEGSGVIIRGDGYILTNGHVVDDAESIQVRLNDGRTFKAKVRGIDPQSDVAVLKIEAKGLPVATLADSAKTRVGEFAIAIGAPFSLDYSVTFGHVSAKGRSNVIQGYEGQSMDQDFIQTDALINPGNSGGPLVNIDGEVIGINTMIRGLHSGIGFAIPSSLAKVVSDELIAEGKFTRGWLGVALRALRDDPETREVIKGVSDGVVVERILPGGPAAKSELERGDVITAVEGKPVATAQQLRSEIRSKKIGKPIVLDVFRPDAKGNGKTIRIKVSPAEWVQPAAKVVTLSRNSTLERDPAGLGVMVHVLTREMAKQFGSEATEGVLVIAVDKGTPAAQKGIKAGDIITAVDKQPVTSLQQFQDALKKADLKKGIALNLLNGTTTRLEIVKAGGD
jgi:serine protease Do